MKSFSLQRAKIQYLGESIDIPSNNTMLIFGFTSLKTKILIVRFVFINGYNLVKIIILMMDQVKDFLMKIK